MRELQHLLNCLNAVTCKHRHGQPISKRRLDDLSNAQVEYEQAVQPEPMVPLRLVEEIIREALTAKEMIALSNMVAQEGDLDCNATAMTAILLRSRAVRLDAAIRAAREGAL